MWVVIFESSRYGEDHVHGPFSSEEEAVKYGEAIEAEFGDNWAAVRVQPPIQK